MNLNNMNQEQTKNIAIIIIVIILIAGGVYYGKNRANKEVLVDEVVEQEVISEENTTPAPLTKEEEAQNQANQANSEELKAQEAVKKAKWNTAMTNARTAFGKGEYDASIAYYNEALSYYKTDTGYSGLFVVYSVQNNIDKAKIAIDFAIKLNPLVTEYWNSKLTFLDEKTAVSFADLKRIYEEGLIKVDVRTKINLVTSFARIAENNKENTEAIALWGYAKTVYPANASVYQQEIDRLKASL